jgi:hypothetical protein
VIILELSMRSRRMYAPPLLVLTKEQIEFPERSFDFHDRGKNPEILS